MLPTPKSMPSRHCQTQALEIQHPQQGGISTIGISQSMHAGQPACAANAWSMANRSRRNCPLVPLRLPSPCASPFPNRSVRPRGITAGMSPWSFGLPACTPNAASDHRGRLSITQKRAATQNALGCDAAVRCRSEVGQDSHVALAVIGFARAQHQRRHWRWRLNKRRAGRQPRTRAHNRQDSDTRSMHVLNPYA